MTRKMTRLRSMTGYATATAQQDGFTLTVSLRSVNHRYFDLRLYLPECLFPLEGKARSAIQSRNPRGHLELKTALEFQDGAELAVDEALAGKYMEVFQRLGAQYGLPAEMTVAALSQLPGVVVRKNSTPDSAITPQLEAAFLKAVEDDSNAARDHSAGACPDGESQSSPPRAEFVGAQIAVERQCAAFSRPRRGVRSELANGPFHTNGPTIVSAI